jgi:hypothetical protein
MYMMLQGDNSCVKTGKEILEIKKARAIEAHSGGIWAG